MRHNGVMLEFTDWAKEILHRSEEAARRFNPDAKIRLARVSGTVQAVLADSAAEDDETVDVEGSTILVERGLEGLVDIEEPHDRVVLKPLGSKPSVRQPH
jgi:hypothetical protein